MNAQQSLALSRTRVSYGCRPEVEIVCAAAEAWFTLQDLLVARGYPELSPQMIGEAFPAFNYVISRSYSILREPVRLGEDPPDGDENA
jgi:hypothetical protein